MSFLDDMLAKPVEIYKRSEPQGVIEKHEGNTMPVQANTNAAEPSPEKLPEADEITSLLEIAVILEDVAGRSGYKFARHELRRLLTAANDAEHEGNKELFIQAVSELRRLMRA